MMKWKYLDGNVEGPAHIFNLSKWQVMLKIVLKFQLRPFTYTALKKPLN